MEISVVKRNDDQISPKRNRNGSLHRGAEEVCPPRKEVEDICSQLPTCIFLTGHRPFKGGPVSPRVSAGLIQKSTVKLLRRYSRGSTFRRTGRTNGRLLTTLRSQACSNAHCPTA